MRPIYVLYIFIYFVRLKDVNIVFTLARSFRSMCPNCLKEKMHQIPARFYIFSHTDVYLNINLKLH